MLLLSKGVSRASVLLTTLVLLGALNSPTTAEEWAKATVKDLDIAKGKILIDRDVIQKWRMRMMFFVRSSDWLSDLQKEGEIEFIPSAEAKEFVVLNLGKAVS